MIDDHTKAYDELKKLVEIKGMEVLQVFLKNLRTR